MRKLIIISFVVLTATLLCYSFIGSSRLKPSELIHWVNDEENALLQRKEFDNYFFEARYKPVDYVISMEARTDKLSEDTYNELKSELDGMQYIDLDIGPMDKTGNVLSANTLSEDEYFERLDYFVTYANYDIFMIQGQDTLHPQLYHFERNYGLAPKNTLLLGFGLGDENSDRDLVIDDQVLGVGRVHFLFREEDIKSTPKLKTS